MAGRRLVYVVYRPGTTEAWMMAGDLPAAPAGTRLPALVGRRRRRPRPDDVHLRRRSACLAPFGVDLAPATATMITLEPAGGAQGEPGPQVAFGELHG